MPETKKGIGLIPVDFNGSERNPNPPVGKKYDPLKTPWGDITDQHNGDAQYALKSGFVDSEGNLLLRGKIYLEVKDLEKKEAAGSRKMAGRYVVEQLGREPGAVIEKRNIEEFVVEKERINNILEKYGLRNSRYELRKGNSLNTYILFVDFSGKGNWLRKKQSIKERKEKLEVKFEGTIDNICSDLEKYLNKEEKDI